MILKVNPIRTFGGGACVLQSQLSTDLGILSFWYCGGTEYLSNKEQCVEEGVCISGLTGVKSTANTKTNFNWN